MMGVSSLEYFSRPKREVVTTEILQAGPSVHVHKRQERNFSFELNMEFFTMSASAVQILNTSCKISKQLKFYCVQLM